MPDVKYGIKGIIGAVVGILLTVFGWYVITAFSDFLPIGLLKAIFWIGLISIWVLNVVVNPILMIMGGKGEWKDAIMSTILFFTGTIVSLILYWMVPPIIEVGADLATTFGFSSTVIDGIGWFGLMGIWVLLMIIAPAYLSVKSSILKT